MENTTTTAERNKVAEVEKLLVCRKYSVAKYHVRKQAFLQAYGLTLNTYGHAQA